MAADRDWRFNRMKQLTKTTKSPLLEQAVDSTKRAHFLSLDDWANRLGLSKRTIHRMIDEGIIPPSDLSFGKTRRWHERTYENWVSEKVRGN
jgi:excisionase family DNA binding protein